MTANSQIDTNMVLLSRIEPEHFPRLLPVLARYLAEIVDDQNVDPAQVATRVLKRCDLDAYWIELTSGPIGFAFVLSLPEGQHELSEFTIFPEHRRLGCGTAAAKALFSKYPGRWRMGLSKTSPQAAGFWGTCLSAMAGVHDLKEGAPFSSRQIKSYNFGFDA